MNKKHAKKLADYYTKIMAMTDDEFDVVLKTTPDRMQNYKILNNYAAATRQKVAE